MADWYAEVTTETGPLTDEQRDRLTETLRGPVTHDTATGRTAITFGTDSDSLEEASTAALQHARDTISVIAGACELISLRVRLVADVEEELRHPPAIALIGTTEGGQLLGVTRQRFDELARTHKDFPNPVAELARGRIYLKASVEWFATTWERTITGRPRRNVTSEQ